MGMLFSAKCPQCWDRMDVCTCTKNIGRCGNCYYPLNNCQCVHTTAIDMPKPRKKHKGKAPMNKILGQITPIKAFQTTDGKKFVGDDAQDRAYTHQEALNREKKRRETSGIPERYLRFFDALRTHTLHYGVTTVDLNPVRRTIRVSHAGNMGARVKDVISNFEHIFGKGSFKGMERAAKTAEANGSPDYLYTKTFQF